jgi:UDP-N-acetylmuramoyl-tripeptide--D-alanyl-D-alanine ligase
VDYHEHFDNKNSLVDALKDKIRDGDKVLVKGSRGMQMETIVEALLDN